MNSIAFGGSVLPSRFSSPSKIERDSTGCITSISPPTKKARIQGPQGEVIQNCLNIYKKHLYFHGTGRKSAIDILKNGMVLKRKKAIGNTALLNQSYGLNDPNACRYHYMQKTPIEAAEYAKAFSCPTILCLILPPSKFHLEIDPVGDSPTAFMTSEKIRRKYILPMVAAEINIEQLEKLNKQLDLPTLSRDQLKDLGVAIQNEILVDRSSIIERAKSYIQQEGERDQITQEALRAQGIDLSNFKEGDTLSVPLTYIFGSRNQN